MGSFSNDKHNAGNLTVAGKAMGVLHIVGEKRNTGLV